MSKKRPEEQGLTKAKLAALQSFTKMKGLPLVRARLKVAVGMIVREILDEMDKTLAGAGKTFSAGALDEWTPKLRAAVSSRLMLPGASWTTDRPNVLAVASDMARIAAILSGGSAVVNKGRVHAAFRACKDHLTCPGNQGSGRWCDFDI